MQIMLVAGNKATELKKYFNDRGTIEITDSYSSLSENRDDILGVFRKLDKLVYVNQYNSRYIREDMSLLRRIIKEQQHGEGLVSFKEIIFFYVSSDSNNGYTLFKSIMEDANFRDYKAYSSPVALSFEEIYNNILGISEAILTKNKKVKVYRSNRKENFKDVFLPEGYNPNEVREIFDYEDLANYEKAKKFAQQTKSNVQYNDVERLDSIYESLDNPNLSLLEIDNQLNYKNIFVVSGEPRSGVSYNTNIITSSAQADGKKVLLINLTGRNDTRDMLKSYGVKYSTISLKNFILTDNISKSCNLHIINVTYLINDIRLDGLTYILDKIHKLDPDIIVIETPKEILKEVLNSVSFGINKLFYSMESLEIEVRRVSNFINKLENNGQPVVILNDIINTHHNRISKKEIKMLFKENIKFIGSITYKKVDPTLFDALVSL